MAIVKANAGDTIFAVQHVVIVDAIENATTGHIHSGDVDGAVALLTSGLAAARPAFGQKGRVFYSTDTDVLERDTGVAWEIWGFLHDVAIAANQHHNQAHAGDHVIGGADPLSVGAPSDIGTANAVGTLTNFVRRDHIHNHPSGLGVNLHHNQAHQADHLVGASDALSVGAPSNIGTANSAGSLTNFVRRDHVHAHPSGLGINLHHNQVHDTTHEPGGDDAMAVDAVAGTGSLRTIGAGAQQSAAGNHGHTLSDISTVRLSGSSVVGANSTVGVNIQTASGVDRHYNLSIRGIGVFRWHDGTSVTATETVIPDLHAVLGRTTSGTDDVLVLVNGTAGSNTALYEVVEFD